MRRFAILVRNEILILARDMTTLFWILIFPFFFLFMMLFSYGFDGKLPLQTIEVVDLDHSAASERFVAEIARTFTESEAIPGVVQRATEGSPLAQAAVRVTLPEGFGIDVERKRAVSVNVVFARDGTAAQFAVRVLRALTVRFNADEGGTAQSVEVVVDDRNAVPALSFTHYILTGILVMSMMSAGMSTACLALAYRRERNGFKMLACMPIGAGSFLLAMLVSRLLVLCLSALLLLLGARYLFGIPLVFNASRLLQSGVVIVLGGTMLLAMGTAMSARLATVAGATLAANLVYIALLFLSDLVMPLAAMPHSVSAVMQQLPTAQFVTALRQVLVAGEGLDRQLPQLAALGGWTLLFAAIARLTFRWHRQAGA